MARFTFVACASVGAALVFCDLAAAQPKKTSVSALPVVPIHVAVADDGDHPVHDGEWIDAQLAQAGRFFGPFGVQFRRTGTKRLGERFARMESREDRDALAAELDPGVVNVFLVASLRDVDDPSLMRMGVHWRKRSDARRHYVIVAASARETTLAHELGHFFGLAHVKTPDNLMSYERTGAEPFVDAGQGKKVHAFAAMYLGSKELVGVIEPPS